jgi:hypothetical protein
MCFELSTTQRRYRNWQTFLIVDIRINDQRRISIALLADPTQEMSDWTGPQRRVCDLPLSRPRVGAFEFVICAFERDKT